ncbi:MAG TPA: hypothetical protein VEP89_04330 [Draconibacterium sp.]|nr:hypothetical protein [Draconibacterium sp.]
MLVTNKISRTLEGPYRIIGFYFVIVAVMSLYEQAWIIFSIHTILGWFLISSYSGVDIDTDKQQFRNFNMWFGVLKTGKWKPIGRFIGLTLVPTHTTYRLYSRSNRQSVSRKLNYSIYFVNNNKRPAISIKICKKKEEAQKSMDELAIWLHLPVFSVKH